MFDEIQQVIEDEINPQLAMHGGGCEPLEYEEGTLTIRLYGGCSGCPGAKMTLLNGITPILQERFPEIKDVRLG
jgi:Fe-S cluster biogenesis protein NfuA